MVSVWVSSGPAAVPSSCPSSWRCLDSSSAQPGTCCSLPLRSDFASWMHLWKNQLGHNAAVCGSEGQGSLVCGGERGCSFARRTRLPACSQPVNSPCAGLGLRPDQIHGMPSHEPPAVGGNSRAVSGHSEGL